MKNLILSCTLSSRKAFSLFVFALVTCINLNGQTESVTINTPVDGTSYCAEQQTMVTFVAEARDAGGGIVSSSLLNWNWAGPNGFSSTDAQPSLTIDDTAFDGDYMVTVSFPNGASATDAISLTVQNTVEINCPDPIIVTPDLSGSTPTCDRDLVFSSFDIDAVNCSGPPYIYSITFVDESGMTRLADDGNPVQGTVTNSTMSQTIMPSNASYSGLPFGFHTLRIDITDPSTQAIVAQCNVEVQVLESINNLACNDLVNVTMTDECEAILTPSMILQGDYCFDAFVIEAELVSDPSVSVSGTSQVTIDMIGTYNVTVTGQSGLSCWGQVLAEDKSLPQIDCDDVAIFCTELGDANPGSTIRGFDRGFVTDLLVPSTASGSGVLMIPFDLDDISGNITNIILNFEAEVVNVSDLQVSLRSPNGTAPVSLLDLDTVGGDVCENSNINVCLSDDGANPYSMFGSPVQCLETLNAFIGSYQPENSFSTFYTETAQNTDPANSQRWYLIVSNSSTTDAINIVEADLQVTTNEGTFLTSNELINSSGCDSSPIITFEDDETGLPCENDLWTVIERTWTVTNQNSGRSVDCVQTINVKKFEVSDIIFPKSFDDLDQESLTCATAGTDTGVPMLPFGRSLDDCGNFQMTSSDLTFAICGPVASKTVRTFSVLDWCVGEIVEHEQVIKIEDNQPIVATCAPDDLAPEDAAFFDSIGFTIDNGGTMPYMTTTGGGACAGSWDFIPPLTIDNACDDDVTFTLSYLLADQNDPFNPDPNGTYIDDDVVTDANGFPLRIDNLPGGQFTWIRIEMEDECGNEGICFSEVFVRDDVRPSPVCVEFTVVSLGDDGCGFLPAASVDNRSFDNCGVESFAVRRLGQGIFEDQLQLCCTDCAMGPIMVELLVTDTNGNTNTCSAEVRLQDNIPITMVSTPPANVTFDCEQSPVDLTPLIEAELARFDFDDNCGWTNSPNTVSFVSDTNILEREGCGAGSVVVRYIVTDECGLEVPGSPFNQMFSFTNSSLTDPSQFVVSRWPEDLILSNCSSATGLDPEGLDSQNNADNIIVNTGACNDIAIGFEDLVFFNVDNACLKLLRTWTVVDWCIAGAPGNTIEDATRSFTQEIKVFDTNAPIIAVSNVTAADSTGVCSADVVLIAEVMDPCTDMFAGQENTVEYTITYADGRPPFTGTGVDASGNYPLGVNTVSFVATDHCGNVSDPVNVTVTVTDAKAPTPYCLGSVVTATMSNAGAVEVWASDYDLGGTDSCSDVDVFFVRNGMESPNLSFTCADIPNGESVALALEVHFRDDAGNSDFCVVTLLLQDNNSDVCDGTGSRIAGNVHTEEHENIENVVVDLLGSNEFTSQELTDVQGNYAFEGVGTDVDYILTGSREDHVLNGISTLDILVMQRHILGAEFLPSAFKVIAADVNNDGVITAIDLITLRKLILGSISEFPNGQTAWRFPNESQTFVDALRPFPYTEDITVLDLNAPMTEQDFVGVKIGDVNASAIVNTFNTDPELEKRQNRSLSLVIRDQELEAGETVSVPVYAENMIDIAGFQYTLNFDAKALTLVSVEPAGIDLDDSNIAFYNADNGSIALSWNDMNGVTTDSQEQLFELVFEVNENTSIASNLFLNSGMTKAEAYTTELNILDVELGLRGSDNTEFVVFQNVPNPFSDNTEIQFTLPSEGAVTLSVFDLNGREILRQTNNYAKGNNTITLDSDQLQATSVMYYTLDSAYGTASKKMIQIR
jgi:hypothetical protein